LARSSVVAFFATTAADGKTYTVEYFNLDAIISVGYRVNSKLGAQFRIWATNGLQDHILKGYSINQRRLKELRQSLRLVRQVLHRYEAIPTKPSRCSRSLRIMLMPWICWTITITNE